MGVTRGARGAQFPGRQFTMGALNHCGSCPKVPTMLQVLSSIQQICFRKSSGSTMEVPNFDHRGAGSTTGAPNLFFAPGAIEPRYGPAQARHFQINLGQCSAYQMAQ